MARQMHEFLHPLAPGYKKCRYCGERKSLVCQGCGYCYECHPAIEEAERRESRIMIDDIEAA
jgi:hypothetical protein